MSFTVIKPSKLYTSFRGIRPGRSRDLGESQTLINSLFSEMTKSLALWYDDSMMSDWPIIHRRSQSLICFDWITGRVNFVKPMIYMIWSENKMYAQAYVYIIYMCILLKFWSFQKFCTFFTEFAKSSIFLIFPSLYVKIVVFFCRGNWRGGRGTGQVGAIPSSASIGVGSEGRGQAALWRGFDFPVEPSLSRSTAPLFN